MDLHAENLKSIVDQGREMAKAGHFDSAGILKKVDAFDRRSVSIIFAGVGEGNSILLLKKLACVCVKKFWLFVPVDLSHLKHPLLIEEGNWRIRSNSTSLTLTWTVRCSG